MEGKKVRKTMIKTVVGRTNKIWKKVKYIKKGKIYKLGIL